MYSKYLFGRGNWTQSIRSVVNFVIGTVYVVEMPIRPSSIWSVLNVQTQLKVSGVLTEDQHHYCMSLKQAFQPHNDSMLLAEGAACQARGRKPAI